MEIMSKSNSFPVIVYCLFLYWKFFSCTGNLCCPLFFLIINSQWRCIHLFPCCLGGLWGIFFFCVCVFFFFLGYIADVPLPSWNQYAVFLPETMTCSFRLFSSISLDTFQSGIRLSLCTPIFLSVILTYFLQKTPWLASLWWKLKPSPFTICCTWNPCSVRTHVFFRWANDFVCFYPQRIILVDFPMQWNDCKRFPSSPSYSQKYAKCMMGYIS